MDPAELPVGAARDLAARQNMLYLRARAALKKMYAAPRTTKFTSESSEMLNKCKNMMVDPNVTFCFFLFSHLVSHANLTKNVRACEK